MNHQYEKYRMEETMSQQTKLIDFLQDKVESTPRKKKWVKLNVILYFICFFICNFVSNYVEHTSGLQPYYC